MFPNKPKLSPIMTRGKASRKGAVEKKPTCFDNNKSLLPLSNITNSKNKTKVKLSSTIIKSKESKKASFVPAKAGKIRTGRWTKSERLAFLRALRKIGRGKWRAIAKTIPTRDTTQTKTHAQTLMKYEARGTDIFAELDEHEGNKKSTPDDDDIGDHDDSSTDADGGTLVHFTVQRTPNPMTVSPTSASRQQIEYNGAAALLELKKSVEFMSPWTPMTY